MKRPLEIIGGGLAGLSLGIALARRGVPVEIREASEYPRHRVCGEFISGVTGDCLEDLGIASAFEGAARLQSAQWFDRHGGIGSLQVSAVGLSRWKLDMALAARFQECGGRLRTGSRCDGVSPAAEGMVSAAGRPRRPGGWVGLKAHYTDLELGADLEMHLGSGGYVGLAKIEDGKVNVCGLFRQERVARRTMPLGETLLRCGLPALARRLQGANVDTGSACSVAGFRLGWQPTVGFALGDAAAIIPPFTGNGMSMAFESARAATEVLVPYCEGRTEWAPTLREWTKRQRLGFARRMRWARLLHGSLVVPGAATLAAGIARRGLLPFQQLLSLVR